MKLIVGLGNPGREYVNTRHNVGYMAIERIADFVGTEFNKKKFNGTYAEFVYDGEKYILLKPEKYMNLSGEVIRDYVNFFKINVSDILIIHDDLDTPVGTYHLRYKGGSGGHNGLKNIELNLHTQEYKRIKIGISNNKLIDTKDYVLGKFTSDELKELDKIFNDIVEIFKVYNKYTFDNIMNKFNNK
jgi:PTH1 family peptidyl-tRNA hydrolase